MMWNMQSYPTTLFWMKKTWHFSKSKHTLTSLTYFQGSRPPVPQVYAPIKPTSFLNAEYATVMGVDNRRALRVSRRKAALVAEKATLLRSMTARARKSFRLRVSFQAAPHRSRRTDLMQCTSSANISQWPDLQTLAPDQQGTLWQPRVISEWNDLVLVVRGGEKE